MILSSKNKYSSLREEFLTNEREGNRLLTKDKLFADIIFQRIQKHIQPLTSHLIPSSICFSN
jgi:hypothetical protein